MQDAWLLIKPHLHSTETSPALGNGISNAKGRARGAKTGKMQGSRGKGGSMGRGASPHSKIGRAKAAPHGPLLPLKRPLWE